MGFQATHKPCQVQNCVKWYFSVTNGYTSLSKLTKDMMSYQKDMGLATELPTTKWVRTARCNMHRTLKLFTAVESTAAEKKETKHQVVTTWLEWMFLVTVSSSSKLVAATSKGYEKKIMWMDAWWPGANEGLFRKTRNAPKFWNLTFAYHLRIEITVRLIFVISRKNWISDIHTVLHFAKEPFICPTLVMLAAQPHCLSGISYREI